MTQNVDLGVLREPSSAIPKLRRFGSKSKLLATLILLAATGYGAWRYFGREEASTPAPPARSGARSPATPVVATTVEKGDFPIILSGLGTVTPPATSVVKTQISGQLLDIKFTEGQAVKAGDVLAQVDPRPYQLTLTQNEGQLRRDLALLQNAMRDLERYKALNAKVKNAISGQQIDTQAALVEQYNGTVAIDRAQVESARLNVSYCRIVSLIDGRVGLRLVDQGNFVQPNDPNGIVVVTQTKPITVIFTLPENRLQPVLARLRAGAKPKVAAFDHGHTERLAEGELFAIDNQIDVSTGTVKLRARFSNEDEKLYPSQFVNAELHVDTLRDVVIAPQAAVQQGSRGPFVYAIKPDNTVTVRFVKLGAASDDRVVIEGGLDAGERVVVEGADKLREGAAVLPPKGSESAGDQAKPPRSEHAPPGRETAGERRGKGERAGADRTQ